ATCRTALEQLLTAMDAPVRIARWTEARDAIPAPLQKAASQIEERLAAGTKLGETKGVGAPQVTARINAMSECIRRLDEAFKAYRTEITASPGTDAEAALALDAAIAEVKDTDNKIA